MQIMNPQRSRDELHYMQQINQLQQITVIYPNGMYSRLRNEAYFNV